jgi:quinol monooxygenase YgiN
VAEMAIMGILRAHDGAADEMEQVVRQLMADSHAEAGCLRYVFCRDADDPLRFVLLERWVDEAAATDHLARPEIAGALERLTGLVQESSQWIRIEPLDAGEPAKRL